MQEILLSRDVILWAGHKQLLLSDVKDMILKYGRQPEVLKACRAMTPMLRLRKDILERHLSPSIIELLSAFNDRKATDQRDRIYGILGLASEGRSMKPNYAKSARRVFIEATTTIINESGNLELLCFQQNDHARQDVFMKRLPSWVPNFGTKWAVPKSLAHPGSRPSYSAGETSELYSKYEFFIRDEELITSGINVGSPTILSEPICAASENFESDLMSALWTVLSQSFPSLDYTTSVEVPLLVTTISFSLTQAVEGKSTRIELGIIERYRQGFLFWVSTNAGLNLDPTDPTSAGHGSRFLDAARISFARPQRLAYDARNETMMLVCAETRMGDDIFVLHKVSVPLVLRRFQGSIIGGVISWERIGSAFVYEYMHGEAYRLSARNHDLTRPLEEATKAHLTRYMPYKLRIV